MTHINNSHSIRKARKLISVIPPTHNLGILLGVLAKPIVGLSEVVNDHLVARWCARGKHHRWGRIGVGGYPSAVEAEYNQQ